MIKTMFPLFPLMAAHIILAVAVFTSPSLLRYIHKIMMPDSMSLAIKGSSGISVLDPQIWPWVQIFAHH
jgi:hypothetical protein